MNDVWILNIIDRQEDDPHYSGCVSVHSTVEGARHALGCQIFDDVESGIIYDDLRFKKPLTWYNDRMVYIISKESVNS